MIEVIRGINEKPVSSQRLVDYFSNRNDIQGILYIGYPIVGVSTGSLPLDAILISREHGVIIFDIEEGTQLTNRQEIRDVIFNNVQAKLLQHKNLVTGRSLKFEISIVTYASSVLNKIETNEEVINTEEELSSFLEKKIINLDNDTYRNLVSVIQTVTNIRKTQKRNEVIKENSKGAKLNKLEASISNLDRHQSAAVIETTEGPQRIRGLAGSGKTIILALKVAYLHTIHPDWDIAVTFNSRSLKGQFTDLITKFTIEHKSEEPDWNKIKILHAWGSEKASGVYSDVCARYGLEYSNFGSAKNRSVYKDIFGRVCFNALKQIENIEKDKPLTGIYDVILIDEAQDFSAWFLKLCYKILKEPKRLIWAYDELQNLNDNSIKSSEELFNISLRNEIGKPKQDIILEKCYRNSRPILVTAQSLGFGIYREGFVQMFDRPALWNEIGYSVEDGELAIGKHVILKRTNETSPDFLENHSDIDDLIIFKDFKNNQEQVEWVASEIIKNLKEDELEHRDIVVINCNPITTEKAVGPIREILLKNGVSNHIAGVTHSPDKFYLENSITFTGIHRAKGNEAPMIYIINSQYSFEGYELIKKRNILFTAITRSKAWVRVCGFGEDMTKLKSEYKKIKDHEFKLDFIYPTIEEMKELNIIHREMTKDEKDLIRETNKDVKKFVRSLHEGVVKKEDIDQESIKELKTLFDDKN